MTPLPLEALELFRREYGAHRAAEGRAHGAAELLSLPYLRAGPLAGQWAVRARTFDAFMTRVVRPMAKRRAHALRVFDLGAGSGWLSHRLALEGHSCAAVDIREDGIDGLGAVTMFPGEMRFERVVASYDELPFADGSTDLAVFNASLHYSTDLRRTLAEAVRVLRPDGLVAILDSPFYKSKASGQAMVAEKHASGRAVFGDRANALLALPFIEFLTPARLADASWDLALRWTRLRVRYPLSYELRGVTAHLRGRRSPSRFDLWTGALG